MTAVFVSHVLEHIEWDDIADVLAEIRRVAHPGASVVAIGPDIDKAAQLVPSFVEGIRGTDDPHPYAHHWDCRESAMEKVMADAFGNARAFDVAELGPQWPAESRDRWQAAVEATA